MTILLDTQAFLWWNLDDAQLSAAARKALEDSRNVVYVSAVVAWEIAVKVSIGKLPLPDPPVHYVPSRIRANGFVELPVRVEHALEVSLLPFHHRDPFDRILVAQCKIEKGAIISSDAMISRYGVPVVW